MDRGHFVEQRWRIERPDINTFSAKVIGRLAEVTQVISKQYFVPFFAKYNLQHGEFDVLATLRRAGKPYTLTPTALYSATLISSGGMTNRLDRLERAALIERLKHPTDRRGVLVALTPVGLELIDDILPKLLEEEQRLLNTLSLNEQQQLDGLLEKLLGGFNQQSNHE